MAETTQGLVRGHVFLPCVRSEALDRLYLCSEARVLD
jgi:hypothetical protein